MAKREERENGAGSNDRCRALAPLSSSLPRPQTKRVRHASRLCSVRAQGEPLTLSHAVSSAEKREQFLSIWPSLSDELVEYAKGEKMPKDAVEWFKRVRLVFRDPAEPPSDHVLSARSTLLRIANEPRVTP